jgi:Flp pilus assembly protein TadG
MIKLSIFKTCIQRGRQQVYALFKASGGVAVVEFAMVLPVMVLLYLGMTEVTIGVMTDRKVTLLTRTLADLTSRSTTLTTTQTNDIFAAATSVLAPVTNISQAGMVISSVAVLPTGGNDALGNPNVQGKICWSEARQGGTALTVGSIVTIPNGFKTPNSSYIIATAALPYKPVLGYALTGTLNLTETTTWPVRNVKEVVRQGVPACVP